MPLLINSTLQGGATSGVGFALDTQTVARDLTFYILGSPGVTAGEVTIEEAQTTVGPWFATGPPVAVVANGLSVARHAGSVNAVRANITTPIIGGTVTVLVMGSSEHDDLFDSLRFVISGATFAPLARSIDYTDNINARNRLSFRIFDETGMLSFQCGQEVILLDTDGLTRLFAGTIDDAETYRPRNMRSNVEGMEWRFRCVDYNQLPDRHLAADAYDDTSFRAMVTDLVATHLGADGVTVGNIDEGPTFTRKIFNYRPLSDCLNELSEDTGFAWWIDYQKIFHFRARESVVAPFMATTATTISAMVRENRGAYRNRQYIRAGHDLTDPLVESFTGDDTRQTFNVSFPFGRVPTVTVNGVPKTVGINGLSEAATAEWLWNKDATEISQRSDLAPLAVTDTLVVTYRGMYPILVQAQDEGQISERQAVEGGSGLYEDIEDYGDIDSADLAFDTALAKLHREGYIRRSITLETDERGLASGQVLHVTLPRYDLDDLFLVQSVTARENGRNSLRYTATLLDGDAVGGWLAFYQRLMAARRERIVRDNEVLLLLRNITDTLELDDEVDVTSAAPESRIGHMRIGYAQIA